MQARIYKPTKTAMQSGAAKKNWILEYILHENARSIDNLMGWTSSSDMYQEVILKFHTKEQAENYAQKHHIEYEVIESMERKVKKKSYADNFK